MVVSRFIDCENAALQVGGKTTIDETLLESAAVVGRYARIERCVAWVPGRCTALANKRRLQVRNWGGFAGASLFPPPRTIRCPLAGWEWVCCEGYGVLRRAGGFGRLCHLNYRAESIKSPAECQMFINTATYRIRTEQ